MEPQYELEEGEARYHGLDDADDTSIDPDIALSYIDEKLQSVLGHFQKDFEGGVSAENLGAKFGGYGSFLPTYQRSPSVLSQPKSSPRFHNHSMPESPMHMVTESAPQNSVAVSSAPMFQRNGVVISSNLHSSQNLRGPSGDGSVRKELRLPSAQVAEKCVAKEEPYLNKSLTSTDQRTLKVRIKVHPNKTAQKNAAIYSGLGLSSPSSMESSPVESGEMSPESCEACNESPATILQVMTSFPVVGDRLLSPLRERLLALSRSETNLGCDKLVAAQKSGLNNSSISTDASTSSLGNVNELKGKKVNSVSQSEHFVETENRGDMVSCLKKNSGSETLQNKQYLSTDLNAKGLSDLGCDTGGSLKGAGFASKAVRESADEAMPTKKRELKSGRMKDRSLNSDLINDKSFALLTGQSGGKFDNQDAKSNSMEKIGEHQIRGFHKDNKEHGRSKDDRVLNDSDVFEGRKDSKGGVNQLKEANVMAKSHQADKLKTLDTKKKSSEGKKKSVGSQLCGKSASELAEKSAGSSAVIKYKKNSGKDALERTSVHKLKESKLDAHRELQASSDKSRLKSANTKIDNQVISGKTMKEPSAYGILSTREITLPTEQAPAAPVLIEDDWVQCDKCQKWRILPQGLKPEHLPPTWLCSMLNWLPGMNSCDISEEETNGALNALYALPENPNNLQSYAGKTEGVVNLADARDFSGNRQTASYMANLGRKKHKVKKSENDELIATPNFTKNVQGEMAKGRALINANQPRAGSISMHKFSDKNSSEQGEHVIMGDEKSRKKIKRESHLSDYMDVKKIKVDNDLASGVNLVMMASTNGLPSKAAAEDIQKHKKYGSLKETKSNLGSGLRVSVKKQDHMQDSLDNGSLDMKACKEREMSSKKRKVKDTNYLETFESDVAPLGVSKVSIKDESSDGGFKKHKKCKISQTEANESSTSKSEQKSKAKGAVTRIILPSNRNSPVNSIVKDQQVKKYKVKMKTQLTLDDIDSLRKDLGCEELSTAATSSSSKVSDSRKRRPNYQVKGSPVESVSSSPMRTCNFNSLSHTVKGGLEKDDAKCSGFALMGSPKKSLDGNINLASNGFEQSRQGNSFFHAEAFDSSAIHLRDSDAREKIDTDAKLSSDVGNDHLGNSDAVKLGERMHAANSNDRKDRMNKNLSCPPLRQQKTVKSSPLQTKQKDKDFGFGIQKDGGKVSDPSSDNIRFKPNKSLKEETKDNRNHLESGTKFVRNSKNVGDLDTAKPSDGRRDNQLKREDDWSNMKFGSSCNKDGRASTEQRPVLEFEAETASRERSTQMGSKEDRSKVDLCRGDKQTTLVAASRPPLLQKGASMDPQTMNASAASNLLKMSKAPGPFVCQNGNHNNTGHPIPDRSVIRNLDAPNHSKRDASNQTASNVLREAEELRDYADRLKSTGFDFEYNEAYFQAALKFLHGASLLETCSGESSKCGETNQLQIYSNTAKLCETCANEYQKRQEMATAALAYKCMEVAYMRVVYCKNMSASRVWHDLQASLQMPMLPQGESPSSSASDVDNTNNQAIIDKTALSKVNGSQPGTHVIAPRNRPSFVRLLDFAKDVNAAMEASRRAQTAFAAANIILEEAQNMEAISSVKRVIDFSFQDVEELTRLVRLAIEAISRQSIGGNR